MEQATSSSNDRHQRALVAYIRQEFEAPVAAILGYAEMILEDATTRGRASILNDLRRLHQAGYRLKELVSGVLDPARLQQDFPDFRRNLRHDLRSSISVINGLGEMLLEDAQNARDEALAHDLEWIVTASSFRPGALTRRSSTSSGACLRGGDLGQPPLLGAPAMAPNDT